MKTLLILVTATAMAGPAWAINKCTGPDGKVSFQDAACSATERAEAVKTRGGNNLAPQGRAIPRRGEPNLKLKGPNEATALLAFYRQWADDEKLAESTARIALAGPVGTMQKLLRDVEKHQAPACLEIAKSALVTLISTNVDAMIQFMQKQEVSNMAYQWVKRPQLIETFEAAVEGARCGEAAK